MHKWIHPFFDYARLLHRTLCGRHRFVSCAQGAVSALTRVELALRLLKVCLCALAVHGILTSGGALGRLARDGTDCAPLTGQDFVSTPHLGMEVGVISELWGRRLVSTGGERGRHC